MNKRRLAIGILCLALLMLLTPTALAAESPESVGRSTAIISSLTLPDYTKATVCESELGRLAADALRWGTGCDMAVVGGGELVGGLPKGDLTEEDIRRVLPDNHAVVLLRVDGDTVLAMLEYALGFSVLAADETLDEENSAFSGFPQLAGAQVEYDVSQLPGQRIRYLRLADGSDLEAGSDRMLTLAVSEYMLEESQGYDMLRELAREETGRGTADWLLDYIRQQEKISPETKSRVRAVGTADNTIARELGILPFLPVFLIVILLVALPRRKKQLRNLDGSRSKRYRDYGDGNYDL